MGNKTHKSIFQYTNKTRSMLLPFHIKDYSLTEKIGDGAFSIVYKASKGGTGEFFAIKVIEKSVLAEKADKQRMQRELDSCAYLKHENVVSLHDFFSDDSRFFLVLDYCAGGDLYTFIRNTQNIRESQAAFIFQQIVSAMSYCHAMGVVHRDLKPQNVLITNYPQIKVTDFGLCGFVIEESKMRTFCGSPFYAAPECLKQVQYDGPMSDCWSLGVILFELVSGKHPWNVSNTGMMLKQIYSASYSIPSDITPACEDLIRSLLKVRPTDRLTCDEILAHPWLKMAPKRNEKSSLPPLIRKTIPMITANLDRNSMQADHGIISPFFGVPSSPDGVHTPPNQPPSTLNKIIIRSRSGSTVQKSISMPTKKNDGSTSSFNSVLAQPKKINTLPLKSNKSDKL